MKVLLFAGIVAITSAPLVCADNLSKVKLVKEKTLVLNGEYFDRENYESKVVRVNETYNSLEANYEILKDFPLNTILNATLLRATSKSGSYRKIRYITVALCNRKDKHFQYLPDTLIEFNRLGKCVPRGDVKTSGHEYFKFYNLLTKKELRNARFRLISTYQDQKNDLYSVELDFVSNNRKY